MKAVVTYHSIDDSGSVVSVHPEGFRAHVRLLTDRGIPVVPLIQLLSPECERGVAITFDDGFENLADVAWPLLRDHGIPATVFVATDWVGRENAWDPSDTTIPRLPLLDWTTLGVLAEEGLDVASHSRSHPRLSLLGADQLAEELEGSRAAIRSELGTAPRAVAYPYGDCDARVVAATRSAGYSWGLTTELSPLTAANDPLMLPRLDAYYLAKPGVMERWGSPGFRRYLLFRRAARRLRASIRRARSTA